MEKIKQENQSQEVEPEEELENRKSSKNALFWSIFILAIILVAFFIGIRFFSEEEYESIEYNGFEFWKIENMWYTQWQLGNKIFNLPLRFNPLEVEEVEIHGKLDDNFNRKDIYVTFDPRNDTGTNFTTLALGAAELTLSLTKAMAVNTIASCAYDVPEICEGRPIVKCDEEGKSVILLEDVGTPEIVLHEQCVILKGYGMDLIKSVDRFLYQWYGIMDDKETSSEESI